MHSTKYSINDNTKICEYKKSITLFDLDTHSMSVSNIPSKAIGSVVTKFHLEPPGAEGTKNCSNGSGHITNKAALPIYGKNLGKFSSQNQFSNCLETWYMSLDTRVLSRLYK